jgi:hypothetical protein
LAGPPDKSSETPLEAGPEALEVSSGPDKSGTNTGQVWWRLLEVSPSSLKAGPWVVQVRSTGQVPWGDWTRTLKCLWRLVEAFWNLVDLPYKSGKT